MRRLKLLQQLARPSSSKILLWVFDGLGGLPHPTTQLSELETAHIPHIHDFARRSSCGVHEPAGPGITTGSGFGHLALFGYPVDDIELPRGVVEVLGSSFCYQDGKVSKHIELKPDELAIRGNFASLRLDSDSGDYVVADRRASSITSQQSQALCELLSREVSLPDASLRWYPGKKHRFSVVIRARGLGGPVSDSDPQQSGLAPLVVDALEPEATHTAELLNLLIQKVNQVLSKEDVADTILLRGAGFLPEIPTLSELYGLNAAAIATYPVYKGVARQVGMDVLDVDGDSPEDQLRTLQSHYDEYDFFFFHIKATDSLAHKKDFAGKVAYFERCDSLFAAACDLGFDVVVLTGDHCTPSIMGAHSWHPVPTALWSRTVFAGETARFTERACSLGTLGIRQARDLMSLMLAEAGRLKAYGP